MIIINHKLLRILLREIKNIKNSQHLFILKNNIRLKLPNIGLKYRILCLLML
jgi:hypothetical protein